MTEPSFQDAAVLLTGPLNVEQKERQVWVNNGSVASADFSVCLENTCNHRPSWQTGTFAFATF